MSPESDPNKYPNHIPYNPNFSHESEPTKFDHWVRAVAIGAIAFVIFNANNKDSEPANTNPSAIECSGKVTEQEARGGAIADIGRTIVQPDAHGPIDSLPKSCKR